MQLSINGSPVGITNGGGDIDASNPVALLVHGAGMNRTVWVQQTRYLNHHGVCALAIDLPGHGNSGGEPLQTVEEMADWLVQLIDVVIAELASEQSGNSVALVGHSMGSLACLCATALAGKKVNHLVLAGTAMSMQVHPGLLEAAERNEDLAGELMTAWGHGPVAHVSTNPTPGLWMLGGGIALLDEVDDDVLFTDLSACNAFDISTFDFSGPDASSASTAPGASDIEAGSTEELFKRVKCPVSFIVGSEDKMTPGSATSQLVAGFDGANVHFLNNVGHMMMIEDPASVRELLRTALS